MSSASIDGRESHSADLAERFLPVYDVSDSVALTVDAGLRATWDALLRADLIEVGRRKPLVALLGAIRMLPDVVSQAVHGELQRAPERMRLRDLADVSLAAGGWTLLGERPGQEIALGLVGKFWRPVIEFADVDADRFTDFDEPGYAKTIYSLSVRRIDDHTTLLAGLMRTATTDERSRAWFRRYWTFGVGSGAHVLVNGLLDVVREDAESARPGDAQPSVPVIEAR